MGGGGDAALSLLKEEFKDIDIRSKKRAAERIYVVAKALGAERSRKELVPWLTELVSSSSEHDEVLYIVANQLEGILDLVGGSKHGGVLLEPLEQLCKVEETLVRESAVEAVNKLAGSVKKDVLETTFLPMVQRLAAGEWFTARVSACGLIGDTLKRTPSPELRKTLVEIYTQLASDDTPMVRRAAAKVVHRVTKHSESDKVVSQMLPIFKALTSDNQDAVRLNAIANGGDVAKVLSKADVVEHFLPTIFALARDRSWRVRESVAKLFGVYGERAGSGAADTLIPVLTDLLRDPEPSVRRAAVKTLPAYAELLGAEGGGFEKKLIPVLKELVENDEQLIVRQALVEVTVQLLSKLPSAMAKTHLRPVLQQFMFAGPASSPDIQLVVLSHLGKISSVLGAEAVVSPKEGWGKLIKAIFEDSKAKAANQRAGVDQQMGMEDVEHPQWRLRRAIINSLDRISKSASGSGTSGSAAATAAETFIVDLWSRALSDDVLEVRNAAAHVVSDFVSSSSGFGKERVAKLLVPVMNDLYAKAKAGGARPNYMHRLVFVHCFGACRKHSDVWKLLLPHFEEALKDPVANVKAGALKVLAESLGDMGKKHSEKFRSLVQPLTKDSDKDVAFWAQQALVSDVL